METKEHPLDLRPEERELPLREAADRRRLGELAAAVRDHEATIRRQLGGPRAHDLALYRRLRRIGGVPVEIASKNGAGRSTAASMPPPTEERHLIRSSGHAGPGEALVSLAEAVRAHERLTRSRSVPKRPADHVLYRCLTR